MLFRSMVDAFSATGVAVELIHPARANLDGMDDADPELLYGLRAPLLRRALPVIDPVKLVTIDVPILNRAPFPEMAFGVQAATFAGMAAARVAVHAGAAPAEVDDDDVPVKRGSALIEESLTPQAEEEEEEPSA